MVKKIWYTYDDIHKVVKLRFGGKQHNRHVFVQLEIFDWLHTALALQRYAPRQSQREHGALPAVGRACQRVCQFGRQIGNIVRPCPLVQIPQGNRAVQTFFFERKRLGVNQYSV